jgi:hypothetical protein
MVLACSILPSSIIASALFHGTIALVEYQANVLVVDHWAKGNGSPVDNHFSFCGSAIGEWTDWCARSIFRLR